MTANIKVLSICENLLEDQSAKIKLQLHIYLPIWAVSAIFNFCYIYTRSIVVHTIGVCLSSRLTTFISWLFIPCFQQAACEMLLRQLGSVWCLGFDIWQRQSEKGRNSSTFWQPYYWLCMFLNFVIQMGSKSNA